MPKLVAIQLEACHHSGGLAWYAYYDEEVTEDFFVEGKEAFRIAYHLLVETGDNERLGDWADSLEEVPTRLSRHAGLRRYYAASAR